MANKEDATMTVAIDTQFGTNQKPGIKTTEFWIAMIVGSVGPLLALLKVFGVVDQSVDSQEVQDGVSMLGEQIVIMVAMLTSLGVSLGYTASRKAIKTETAKAVGMIAMMGEQTQD